MTKSNLLSEEEQIEIVKQDPWNVWRKISNPCEAALILAVKTIELDEYGSPDPILNILGNPVSEAVLVEAMKRGRKSDIGIEFILKWHKVMISKSEKIQLELIKIHPGFFKEFNVKPCNKKVRKLLALCKVHPSLRYLQI